MASSSKFKHVCTYPGCESKFFRPSKLQTHLRKHTDERPFECDEENCSKTYTNNSHLRRHKLRTHQNDNNKTYQCAVEGCGTEFTNYDNMKRHKNTVHKKKYFCAICDEGFTKKHKLRTHMTTHTGEINLKCELCSSTFETKTEYNKHKNSHKTYTCTCGEVFHRWTVYCQHRRIKHRQKYTCKVCNREFAVKLNRDNHLQTHNDPRTMFKCPVENCERFYFYKYSLQYHIERFHMKIEKPLPPSKLKLQAVKKDVEPSKTVLSGRKRRKDVNAMKQSSALKLVGLTVPFEAEKAIINGEQIDIEMETESSDQLIDTSDYSDLEVNIKMLGRADTTSDSDTPIANIKFSIMCRK